MVSILESLSGTTTKEKWLFWHIHGVPTTSDK